MAKKRTPSRILIYNTQLFGGIAGDMNRVASGLAAFMRQPLSAVVRLDLQPVIEAIMHQLDTLTKTHIDLLRRCGATEHDGVLFLPRNAPAWAQYKAEWDAVCEKSFAVPIVAPVRIPARLLTADGPVDLILDGATECALRNVIEIVR